MDNINLSNALKAVQSGLTTVTTAGKTQTVMLHNADGTPAGKIPLSTDAVIDLTTGQKLSAILEHRAPTETALYVDMGLPSGVLWAKRNIDLTQADGFAASEYQYECSFCSWGNTFMINPKSGQSFIVGNNSDAFDNGSGGTYDWGTWDNSKNATEDGYLSTSVYGQTPGCALTGDAGLSYDAARVNLGAPWRLPTTAEFKELYDNCDFVQADGSTVIGSTTTDKRVTVNGIVGLLFKSKINGNTIFFACSGYGSGSTWSNRGSIGYYWTSSFVSARYARCLGFDSGGVRPQSGYGSRYLGLAVRPVQ